MNLNNQQQFISIDDKLIFLTSVRNVGTMFQNLIGDHPAAREFHEKTLRAWMGLGNLFNKASDLHHRAQLDAPGNPPGYIPTRKNYWANPTVVTKVKEDDAGIVQLTRGHYHELMDRAHCLEDMFDALVVQHPVAAYLQQDVDTVGHLLADVYQTVASRHHDVATAAEQKG